MILAVTPGDPQGIGPEIVWKTLTTPGAIPRGVSLLCVGAREPFDKMGVPVVEAHEDGFEPPRSKKPFVWMIAAPDKAPRGKFLPGYQSGWSIAQAVLLVKAGIANAIVTGPISKERLNAGGYAYPGHTEMLADHCLVKGDVTMMLANDQLRITLVTTHLGIKDVPRELTADKIRRAVLQTHASLTDWFGIRKPNIAIAALNPHAGESGMFGREEIRVITPEIKRLQKKLGRSARLDGPLPADTLFAKHIMAKPGSKDRYDAVVCMYHDQGLIPVKLLDFPNTVNVTLGLPIVRTSVDHGTGFDIAGKGIADPSSLQSAIRVAHHIVQNKKR